MRHTTRILAIIHLAYPIIIGQIGNIMQGWADTIMVGQYGTPELSAAGFVNNVFNLVVYFLMGISYATSPMVARHYGQKQHMEVLRTFYNSNALNLLAALFIVAVMGTLYVNMDVLGQPVQLMPLIRPYYLILLASMPFLALFNSMKQFSDAMGDTKTPMWIMLGANVANLVLNYLLIFTFDLGLVGAGLATLASRMLMPLAMYVAVRRYVLKHRLADVVADGVEAPRCTRKGMLLLARLGLPISAQLCLEAGSFNVCAIFMGWIGADALAMHQIACTVGTVCFMTYYGVGAAAAIRMAHFRGMGDWTEVRKTAHVSFALSMSIGVVATCLVLNLSPYIASAFTTSESVKALFYSILPCFACYQFGDCLQTIYANALRAIESVKAMMGYAFLAYCIVSIPLAYVFAFPCGMGAAGVWWSFPFGLTVAGVCYFLQFRKSVKVKSRGA